MVNKGGLVMMHECPKCGFVQPKDRYCANCGLDIDSYQPTPKPLWQRLLRSTPFQVGIAVGLILAMALFIGLQDRNNLQDALNVTSLPTGPMESEQQVENEPLDTN